MRRLLLAPLSLLIGCGDDTGTIQLTLNRVGDPANLVATNGAVSFPVVLTEGEVSFAAINFVDLDAGEAETPSFEGIKTFDFVASQRLALEPVTVVPVNFEEIHVIPADNAGGLSVHLAFAVTLSDNSTADVTADLTFGTGVEEQKLAVAIDVAEGDAKSATIALDIAKLVSGVDFDALAADLGATINLVDGTGDPAIDGALAVMVENVFTSFAFVSAQ